MRTWRMTYRLRIAQLGPRESTFTERHRSDHDTLGEAGRFVAYFPWADYADEYGQLGQMPHELVYVEEDGKERALTIEERRVYLDAVKYHQQDRLGL